MPTALAPAAPEPAVAPPPATGGRLADGRARPASALAQALHDHLDQPDADHAAQVLRCIDEAAVFDGSAGEAFDLPLLQARLGPADALVLYAQQGDELLACVVQAAGVQVFRRLAHWHDVRAAWRLARFQLDALCHGAGPPRADWPQLFKRAQLQFQVLHGLVWAPLVDALGQARRVLLVPTAGLSGLPFAALQDALTCVAQRHLLAEVPSLALALRGLSPPDGPLFAASTGSPGLGVVVLGLDDDLLRGAANLAARVRALLASGTWRVLVRRWSVDDAVTARFMARFEQERRLGRGPAEALSEAQADLMVNRPHPAFWAGFVLHGGW